jgi:hypothetical protein
MTDRDAPYKNPARVPMVLQAMDDLAAHHEPLHILTEEGLTNMARTKIEKTGIYKDSNGNQFFMMAGDETTRELEFSHRRGDMPEARALSGAPENKARQAVPETKSRKSEAE